MAIELDPHVVENRQATSGDYVRDCVRPNCNGKLVVERVVWLQYTKHTDQVRIVCHTCRYNDLQEVVGYCPSCLKSGFVSCLRVYVTVFEGDFVTTYAECHRCEEVFTYTTTGDYSLSSQS